MKNLEESDMLSGGFTDKAKMALSLAEKLASRMNTGYVGTEHLLIGLLRENTGVAARVLKGNGADEEKILEMIRDLIMPEAGTAVKEKEGYSPRVRKVLEEAHRKRGCTSAEYVGDLYPETICRHANCNGAGRQSV